MLLSPDYNIRRMQNIKLLMDSVLTCAVCYSPPKRARRGLPSLSDRIGGWQTAAESRRKEKGKCQKKGLKNFEVTAKAVSLFCEVTKRV